MDINSARLNRRRVLRLLNRAFFTLAAVAVAAAMITAIVNQRTPMMRDSAFYLDLREGTVYLRRGFSPDVLVDPNLADPSWTVSGWQDGSITL
jgi:peptidoglycan/LPS O-acetylase OafA/YrhL